jgi:hypothetical protein
LAQELMQRGLPGAGGYLPHSHNRP